MTTPDPRISKPHPHKRGYRCEVKTPSGAWRHGPTRPTEEEARIVAAQIAEHLQHEHGQTVSACIDRYLEHHKDKGTRARTIVTYRQHLIRFFAPVLERPLSYVTPVRAAGLYEKRRVAIGERTGLPISVDTHRGALGAAKHFLGWCKIKKWVRVNALAEVQGIGSKKRGKPQPTIDEARIFWATCLREAAQGDAGALAAAMAISMGLRSGEIVSRVVRDLDSKDEAGLPHYLRVADNEALAYETKTRGSQQPVLIPEELRELLLAQARDKLPTALLFPSTIGKMNWTVWVNRAVHRLCRLASIPEVCAHALRGCAATTAAATGDSPQRVANMLRHSNPNITRNHYIQKGTVEAAQAAQGLRVLRGGK